MKTKCPICKSKKKKGPNYSQYCEKCGLFIGKIDAENITSIIDLMIQRWGYGNKKFNYYKIWQDGHIMFKFRGVRKLIKNITFGSDITFEEFGALVQIISFLTIEFEFNITALAIDLFAFSSQFIVEAKNQFDYWLKVGIKNNDRTAYEYLLYNAYSAGIDSTRRGKKKIRKIKEYLRKLPNDLD